MPDHHFTLVELLRIIAATLLAVVALVFYINIKLEYYWRIGCLGTGVSVSWAIGAQAVCLYHGLSQSPAVKPLVNNAPVSILFEIHRFAFHERTRCI